VLNLDRKPTTINQVGFAGINLGRLDFIFDRRRAKHRLVAARPYLLAESMV
jgi:5'-nucleotidase